MIPRQRSPRAISLESKDKPSARMLLSKLSNCANTDAACGSFPTRTLCANSYAEPAETKV